VEGSSITPRLAAHGLPTAPASPSEEMSLADGQVVCSPSAIQEDKYQDQDSTIDGVAIPPYPTPPNSSSSSSMRKKSDDCSDGGVQVPQGSRKKSRRKSTARLQPGTFVLPMHARRKITSLNPLSNITTSSAVHAPHISNPATSSSSTESSTPTTDLSPVSALSSLNSHLELAKLTNGVSSSRSKNTPPLTPRALSNDGSEPLKNPSPYSQRNHTSSQDTAKDSSTARPPAPVGPPKGKLLVKISGARGLKPSYAPYAVVVFEWIESYAHDAKQGGLGKGQEARNNLFDDGMQMKRPGADLGRSMAIPMKSRQSSTTSLSEHKDFKNRQQVTDPRWDHEAVL